MGVAFLSAQKVMANRLLGLDEEHYILPQMLNSGEKRRMIRVHGVN